MNHQPSNPRAKTRGVCRGCGKQIRLTAPGWTTGGGDDGYDCHPVDDLAHRNNVPEQVVITVNRGDLEDLENLLLWAKQHRAEYLWGLVHTWLGKSTD